jgi:hypothetical protein
VAHRSITDPGASTARVSLRLFGLPVLFGRRDRSKELEILILRHDLSIPRRQPSTNPRVRLLS